MGVGERLRGQRGALALIIGGLAALMFAALTPGPRPSAPRLDWLLCPAPTRCRPVDVPALALTRPTNVLKAVYLDARQRPAMPLAVHITAMASAELRWNGMLIGRNGVVGENRAQETPGQFDAVFLVPPDLVRPGPNLVTIRLSAHHLWAPVVRPIHRLSVGPFEGADRNIFIHYLPTLIVIGLLLFAFVANLSLWLLRRGAGMAIFPMLAGTIVLQAAIETSKLALVYPYPWQLARLVALAGLATLAGLLVTAAALSWVREWRMRAAILLIVALGLAGAWLFLPWWDAKALWGFRAGVFGALVAAAIGGARGAPYARPAGIGCIAALALSGIPGFLDFSYYLIFVGLFACQIPLAVRALRPAESIATAVPVASSPGDLIVIPNGGSQQRVTVRDILYVQADDDYSVVHLVDGRQLLATINLAAILRLAPGRFLRVHRSHAISPEKVAALHRTGRPARTVELVGGTRLPVGRTYWKVAVGLLATNGASIGQYDGSGPGANLGLHTGE
jgi:hypothetical protein